MKKCIQTLKQKIVSRFILFFEYTRHVKPYTCIFYLSGKYMSLVQTFISILLARLTSLTNSVKLFYSLLHYILNSTEIIKLNLCVLGCTTNNIKSYLVDFLAVKFSAMELKILLTHLTSTRVSSKQTIICCDLAAVINNWCYA